MNEIEPKITKEMQTFEWNFEDVKAFVKSSLEKYKGLVVTDENFREMELQRRSIVSLRTNMTRFKKNARERLSRPWKQASIQIEEIMELIDEVEAPLNKQFGVYEQERIEKVSAYIEKEYGKMADESGLDEKFRQFDIVQKWLNKTQKWKDTLFDLRKIIDSQLAVQNQEIERQKMAKMKYKMAQEIIKRMNVSYKLLNPITDAFITEYILSFDTDDIEERIESEAAKRKHIEDVAAETALKKKEMEEKGIKETEKKIPEFVQPYEESPIEHDDNQEFNTPEKFILTLTAHNLKEAEIINNYIEQAPDVETDLRMG